MFAGSSAKDLLEVRTADAQDHLVGPQQFAITRQGHVNQITTQEQAVKPVRNVILEVLPAQRKLFHLT